MTTIIRRRKLGMSSVRGIVDASTTNIQWVRSDRQLPEDSLYIRWGCTASVPSTNVINKSSAIHLVNDKREFRMELEDLCPTTWFHWEDVPMDKLQEGVIVRRAKHSQGRHLHVVDNLVDLVHICNRYGENNYYISEIIDKVAEYRVAVVQGRVVWVAKKTPSNPDDIAWNVARGGRFDNVRWDDWPLKAVRISIEAFNLSGLDFGGVDVMVDREGRVYVLEINSAPSLTSPYRQQCMAKAFDYIVQHGKDTIPLIQERGGYKKFIHPAITERAILSPS